MAKRIRRLAKWLSTTLCIGLLAVFVFSGWWHFDATMGGEIYSANSLGLIVGRGGMFLIRTDVTDPSPYEWDRWSVHYNRHADGFGLWHKAPEVSEFHHCGRWYANPKGKAVRIPLILPLAALLLPTSVLWLRDRPIPPGYCPTCRYDLTGNISGVCPECGSGVPNQPQKSTGELQKAACRHTND